jgi:predicted ATP-dependent endonuclease of OLD family
MARIRVVEIDDFRGIYSLRWLPSPGVNCLIGPGDSGKSTIIDAIELCLGARRTVPFTDADFRHLNIREILGKRRKSTATGSLPGAELNRRCHPGISSHEPS